MPRVNRTPAQRDRQLERVRRLRRAIVSAGVLGSLGLAGFVAVSTEQQRAGRRGHHPAHHPRAGAAQPDPRHR